MNGISQTTLADPIAISRRLYDELKAYLSGRNDLGAKILLARLRESDAG